MILPTGFDLLLWVGLHVVIQVVYNLCLPLKDLTRVKLRKKFENLVYTLAYASVAYYLGDQGTVWDWYTAVALVVAFVGFDLLGRVSFLQNSLRGVEDWSVWAYVVYGSAGVIGLVAAAYHAWLAVEADVWIWWGGCLLVAVVANVLPGYLLRAEGDGVLDWLIFSHHWQIGLILVLFARFPEIISQVSAGICQGIFLHGATVYGVSG